MDVISALAANPFGDVEDQKTVAKWKRLITVNVLNLLTGQGLPNAPRS
jgi:hypothetical protein